MQVPKNADEGKYLFNAQGTYFPWYIMAVNSTIRRYGDIDIRVFDRLIDFIVSISGTVEGDESLLFRESRILKFDSRSLIVFVQTSQPIQTNLRPITMRIIALHKDLSPYTGE